MGLSKTSSFSPFRRHIFKILRNKANIVIQYYLALVTFPLAPKYVTLMTLNGCFTLNSILRQYVYSSEAWLSELG